MWRAREKRIPNFPAPSGLGRKAIFRLVEIFSVFVRQRNEQIAITKAPEGPNPRTRLNRPYVPYFDLRRVNTGEECVVALIERLLRNTDFLATRERIEIVAELSMPNSVPMFCKRFFSYFQHLG